MPPRTSIKPVGEASALDARAFAFHGVELPDPPPGDGQSRPARCPFCDRAGEKFRVEVATTRWDCKACGRSGNAATFLRQLWEAGREQGGDLEALTVEKGLSEDGLKAWGLAPSVITGEWLVPGHGVGPARRLDQIYRYVEDPKTGKSRWWATPGAGHCLLGLPLFDAKKPLTYLCEGLWDAIALWEALRKAKKGAKANVLATPGANVFKPEWPRLFKGRAVALMYDNDHPRQVGNRVVEGAGPAGAKKAAALLAAGGAGEVLRLEWGPEGYDPDLPHGYDVCDALSSGEKGQGLSALLAKVVPWKDRSGLPPQSPAAGRPDLTPLPCESWGDLEAAWQSALRWRRELGDVLAVALAVCVSTEQIGDQLFLQMIGDAGSGKTRICDGLLVSKNCYPLEHLTGFHSGWKDFANPDEDYSLLARVDRKTMITPEGDVIMASSHFDEVMSQQRRIFDGTSGASYKNQKSDKRYTGLRTPWIMAGTPALLDKDQSRLGDRFLRVCIAPPSDEERALILRKVALSSFVSIQESSNGSAESAMESRLAKAYRLTGGYVDYLRANATTLLGKAASLTSSPELVAAWCERLAELAASMRARPGDDHRKKDQEAVRELPTRLTSQLTRLAVCLAAVLNREGVEGEALRIVRKVALDTSRGKSLEIAKLLYRAGPDEGATALKLAALLGRTDDSSTKTYLGFLRGIGVVESFKRPRGQYEGTRWRLTDKTRELLTEVNVDAGT